MKKQNPLFLFIMIFFNFFMKKITYLILITLVMLFSIVLSSNAATIENEAEIFYKDISGKIYNHHSNKKITEITEKENLDVSLVFPQTEKRIKKVDDWYFPGYVVNIGKENDKYQIKIDSNSLANIDIKIFYDANSNKILDTTDIIVSETIELAPNESYPIIISFKGNVIDQTTQTVFKILANPSDILITTVVSATSGKDISIKDVESLNSIIEFNSGGGDDLNKPDPSKDDDANNKNNPNIVIRKFVYPTTPVQEGDVLTYTIEVRNIGEAPAETVKILDKLPKDVYLDDGSFPSATNDGKIEYSQDNIKWDSTFNKDALYIKAEWDSLAVGGFVSLFFYVKVKEGVESTDIENRAYVEFKEEKKSEDIIEKQVLRKDSNITSLKLRNEYYVEGTIYDKKTGLPKDNVIVIIYDLEGNEIGREITGKTGVFKIDVPKKGEYRIVYAEKDGTVISEAKVFVKNLGKNSSPIEISGKVINSQTEEPIVDAIIEVLDKDGNVILTIKTDKDGNYLIKENTLGIPIDAGIYTIRVTKKDNNILYTKMEILVNSGDKILNLDILIDPLGIVYDELGGLNVPIPNAEVKLVYNCNDPNSFVKLEDFDSLEKQNNPFTTPDDGTYQFLLTKEQLTNKTYCMYTTAVNYEPKKLVLRMYPSTERPNKYIVEVIDEKGNVTILKNVESIPYNIPLKPQSIFKTDKSANKNTIEIGDVVTYTIEVTNKLRFTIANGLVIDKLPFGFKYINGTLSINKKLIDNFSAINELKVNLGDMKPEEKFVIKYQAQAGIRVEGDASINIATPEGKGPTNNQIKGEPAKATVFVRQGVFRKNGTIIGKIFIDNNNNLIPDNGDKGVENIALYTSNGLRILSDKFGKFSIPDIPNGDFSVHLDKSSLPNNLYMPKDAIELVKATNEKIDELSNNNLVNLDNINGKAFVITDDKAINFAITKNNGYNYSLELKENKFVYFSDKNIFDVNELGLIKGLNKLTLIKNDNDSILEQKNFYLYLIPKISLPKAEEWIGDDDIMKRVFVPESGLAKVNFRLVKLDSLEINLKTKDENILPLAGLFVFPSQIAMKDIPYVTYPDIQNHWVQKTVEHESGLEIIHGYPDGKFKPARNITRAEAVKLILVAMKSYDIQKGTEIGYLLSNDSKVTAKVFDLDGNELVTLFENEEKKKGLNIFFWDGKNKDGKLLVPDKYKIKFESLDSSNNFNTLTTSLEIIRPVPNYRPIGESNFKDVDPNHWSNPFIKDAVEESIFSGYLDNTFRPDNTIARYEIAVAVVKAMKLDLSNAKEVLPFEDAQDIPKWAIKYVYLSYVNKLLPEFPDNKFRPNRAITRAEVAVIVNRLIKNQKLKNVLKGQLNSSYDTIIINEKTFKLDGNKDIETELDVSNFNGISIKAPQ